MKAVVVWGASGHAKVVNEALSYHNAFLTALVDNRAVESPFPSVPVLRGEAELSRWLREQRGGLYGIVAVGGDRGKDRIALRLLMAGLGLEPLTIVHRTAFVASDARIGSCCQILAMASVCSCATIEDSVIVNTGASVDHDTFIGEGSHIGPGSILAGEVIVESRVFIGAGAVVLPRVTIGADSVVGAGAVVTRNVAPSTVVVGVPAHPLKYRGT